ncbi:MAG: ferritin family protein [Candidatus Eisenbacteria sp.]|nr:ferritin family protein [Candidatus Eisenbacteria bacterium]
MSTFGSADEVLDFAIKSEQEAVDFYTDLAGKMENPAMKKVFEEFAKEEMDHKAKLTSVKSGKRLMKSGARKVTDLKIADYTVEAEPTKDMDYREALILAMQNEKAAFKLYSDLAATAQDDDLKDLFLALAQEEARHKLRFELEYDDDVLKCN